MDFSFHSYMVFFTSTLCQTYFVSSIIISLLLFTNAVISSGFNGLCAKDCQIIQLFADNTCILAALMINYILNDG